MVICNSCQWAASLISDSGGFRSCPLCRSSLEVIPVVEHESYTMNIHNRTIDIEFNKE